MPAGYSLDLRERVVDAVEKRNKQRITDCLGRYALKRRVELGRLDCDETRVDWRLQLDGRVHRNVEVAEPGTLQLQAAFADRTRGALTGEDHHRVSGAGQKRGEQASNPTRTEHRHAITIRRHATDLSWAYEGNR